VAAEREHGPVVALEDRLEGPLGPHAHVRHQMLARGQAEQGRGDNLAGDSNDVGTHDQFRHPRSVAVRALAGTPGPPG
jgi:hypothetical protein